MRVTIARDKRHSYSFEASESETTYVYINGEVALIIEPDEEIASGGVM